MMMGPFPFGALPFLLGLAALILLRRSRVHSRRELRREPPEPEESLETRIFRLANRLEGRVTVSDLVVHLGLPSAEAEKELNRLISGQRVQMNVEEDGVIVYEFTELKRKRLTP
ncbi:MAG TPA: hypothetical protein VMV90_03500 [Rectinemataceae bacterium]|nr:hypothetical protein [Rectinemataceae bacterium]